MHARLRPQFVTGLLLLSLAGCGGGGSGIEPGGGGGGGVGDAALPAGTAKFSVDLKTGQVSVDRLEPSKNGTLAVISGNRVGFVSSTVIDEPGNVGRKAINVALINNSAEPLGQAAGAAVSGFRVIFEGFATLTGTDLRHRTVVERIAGSGAATSTDGSVASASFKNPVGIAIAPNGTIYVTDAGTNKIRKISNGQVTTFAGSGSASSFDGAGINSSFNTPIGIAVHPDGDLIVADSLGHKIRRITPTGLVTTVAGTGTAGSTNGAGNVAQFNRPQGIAVASDGRIYLTEQLGHRIRRIVLTGSDKRSASSYTVITIAGNGSVGTTNGVGAGARFSEPRGITVDSEGTLYVADTGNSRIRRVSPNGEVSTISGTTGGASVDGPGSVARYNSPYGIVTAGSGLLITEVNGRRVRQLTLNSGGSPNNPASWTSTSVAGTGVAGTANGAGNVAQFTNPYMIAYNGGSKAYLCDYGANMIRGVNATGGSFPIPTPSSPAPVEPVRLANSEGHVAGNPTKQYIDYPESLAPHTASGSKSWVFAVPSGVTAFEFVVTVEASTQYLAGLQVGIQAGSPKNIVRTLAGNGLGGFQNGSGAEAKFNSMNGICVDRDGNVYVADTNNHMIRRISRSGRVSTVAGSTAGAGASNGPGNVAQFNGPRGVVAAPDGQSLYVTDSNSHTIRRISLTGGDPVDAANWQVATIAGFPEAATYVEGTGDIARFNFPVGITLSQTGNLFITEYSGNRVRMLQSFGGSLDNPLNWRSSLIAGSSVSPVGTAGNTDGFGTAARFDLPAHIAIDNAGVLYVADVNNSRIRKITQNTDVSTVAGSTFGYLDGQGTAAQLGQPNGVCVDSAGYLYVADTSFHRIRRISPTGAVATIAGTGDTFPADVDGRGNVARFYFPLGIACDASGTVYVSSGGTYEFQGGGGVTSPGLKVRMIQRILE